MTWIHISCIYIKTNKPKNWVVTRAWDSSINEAETGGSLELTGQVFLKWWAPLSQKPGEEVETQCAPLIFTNMHTCAYTNLLPHRSTQTPKERKTTEFQSRDFKSEQVSPIELIIFETIFLETLQVQNKTKKPSSFSNSPKQKCQQWLKYSAVSSVSNVSLLLLM